jgi:type II secretory pathway component PulM
MSDGFSKAPTPSARRLIWWTPEGSLEVSVTADGVAVFRVDIGPEHCCFALTEADRHSLLAWLKAQFPEEG